MAPDGWTCVAGSLRGGEASMLRELLGSAGIDSVVEDGGSAAPFPLPGFAVASVLVPAADAARAREIVAASGLVASGGDASGEGQEIPEEEWRAPPLPEPPRSPEAEAAADADAAVTLRFLENVAAVVLLGAAVVLALFGRFSTAISVALVILGRLVMRRGGAARASEREPMPPPEAPPAPRRMAR